MNLAAQMLALSAASLLLGVISLRISRRHGTVVEFGVSLGFVGASSIAFFISAAVALSGVPL